MLNCASAHVAVVIPSYNALTYLPDAINSVFAQTYRDYRIYVVDDGSTDSTRDYVESIRDPRVVLLAKPNGGPSSARNYGIARSVERLVAFLDSDDYWYPKKLERQIALMESNSCLGLVYAYQHTVDRNGLRIGSCERGIRGKVFEQLLSGNLVTGSASMVLARRDVLERVGPFREELNNGEDWEMWLRIARSYEIDFVPDYLAAIRVHGTSAQQDTSRMAEGLGRFYGVVVSEFALRGKSRRRLARHCLPHVASGYSSVGDPRSAATLRHWIREDPIALLGVQLWSAYACTLLGRRRVLAIKYLLLGRDRDRIREGDRGVETAVAYYVAGERTRARKALGEVIRIQPRFVCYVPRWGLYLKILLGVRVVRKRARSKRNDTA